MQLVFSDQAFPTTITKSMFLAGPSPRKAEQFDWRHNALKYLEEINYTGTVFIPIPKDKFYGNDDQPGWTYYGQIEWEKTGRNMADVILFWVDREIDIHDKDLGMPGFTTNVEFGKDLNSGKIFYGRPDSAPKCRYLDNLYEELDKPVINTLEKLIDQVVDYLGEGALRQDGETYVPLFIWNSEQFQSWYGQLKTVGNKLIEAKLLHHATFSNKAVFCYILWVNVWVEAEQRFKSNEFVFARKDISSVVAYYRPENFPMEDTQIVLVKEFRSPVNNKKGFVYELPGGSSVNADLDPRENAKNEMHEEAGLDITDFSRFHFVGERQMLATLSSHKAQVYSIALTAEEFIKVSEYANNKTTFGIQADSEITYVEFVKLKDLKETCLDYSMLGMIYEAMFFQ